MTGPGAQRTLAKQLTSDIPSSWEQRGPRSEGCVPGLRRPARFRFLVRAIVAADLPRRTAGSQCGTFFTAGELRMQPA